MADIAGAIGNWLNWNPVGAIRSLIDDSPSGSARDATSALRENRPGMDRCREVHRIKHACGQMGDAQSLAEVKMLASTLDPNNPDPGVVQRIHELLASGGGAGSRSGFGNSGDYGFSGGSRRSSGFFF